MRKRKIRPPKVEMDFTDLNLTAYGGSSILAEIARKYGLFELLADAVRVKVRNRGATDAETLWAMIACLARGDGALSDLDALRADAVARTLLGLHNVPEARRAGEWLAKVRTGDVKGLWEAARRFAERVAPLVCAHEVETRGYVPLFIDATGIEVDGELFERARRDYEGRRGYWLHAVFLGGLWAAGQPCPGGGRVALNWRTLLDWTAGMVPPGTPAWLRADNAYYKGDLVRVCAARGWDYSVSLTNDTWRRPVPEQLEGLPDAAWTDIGGEEEAIFATHRPGGWDAEQRYVVVRRRAENGQGLLVPHHTVILVSRGDLPLDELVRRHRGKQWPALRAGSRTPSRGRSGTWTCTTRRAAATGRTRRSTRSAGSPRRCCGGAVHGFAEADAQARSASGDPARDAHRGVHGAHGAPAVRAVRQDQLPPRLAVRGDGASGGPRPAACVGGLTGPVRFDAALRRGRTRPLAGKRRSEARCRPVPAVPAAPTASAPGPEPLSRRQRPLNPAIRYRRTVNRGSRLV